MEAASPRPIPARRTVNKIVHAVPCSERPPHAHASRACHTSSSHMAAVAAAAGNAASCLSDLLRGPRCESTELFGSACALAQADHGERDVRVRNHEATPRHLELVAKITHEFGVFCRIRDPYA